MSRADLDHAAELLERLLPDTTPAPWRDSVVDGNRYHALVADTCTRRCDEWAARYADGPPEWQSHPHDGYGGCLVAESQHPGDRRLQAVLRNVADALPDLLRAVAAEDPIDVGRIAREIAAAVIATHTPRRTPS